MAQLLINYGDEGKEWMVDQVDYDLQDADIRGIVQECSDGGSICDPNDQDDRLEAGAVSAAWIRDAVIYRSVRAQEGDTILLRPKVAFGC